jgi:hypothetical protein
MTDRPDAYAEFRALAVTLETDDVDLHTIIDAAFRVAMDNAIRTAGRQAAARALLEIAVLTADPNRRPLRSGRQPFRHGPGRA